jgi:hypothetical protein
VRPELEDREDTAAGLRLQLLEGIEIPRVDDDRLLAERTRTIPEGDADVGIVQVVRAAYAHSVDPALFRTPAKLVEMAIEPLDLTEVPDLVAVTV